MQYTSSDFDKTKSTITPKVPKRLVHTSVFESGFKTQFSKERGHGVAVVNLPSTTISMTIGELTALQATGKHRHNYETILYIIEGCGETLINDSLVSWSKGDAVYVPPWTWHQHRNLDSKASAKYIACENTPLLQNLGNIALREEASDGH